jgi:hypothetical protein
MGGLKIVDDLLQLHHDTIRQTTSFYETQWHTRVDDSSVYLTPATVRRFVQTFQEVQARHALTVEPIAELMIGLRPYLHLFRTLSADQPSVPQVFFRDYVESFLYERITIQLLCDHLVSIGKQYQQQQQKQQEQKQERKEQDSTAATRVGAVTVNQPIRPLVESAILEAGHLCEAHFLTRPAVRFVDRVTSNNGHHGEIEDDYDDDTRNEDAAETTVTATYIRPWLHYTLVELFKNSMVATIERPNPKGAGQWNRMDCVLNDRVDLDDDDDEESVVTKSHCPIFVHIKERRHTIEIEILDQGGGLRPSAHSDNNSNRDERPVRDLFEFAQCSKKYDRLDDQQTYATVRSPMNGLGVGLAMSRMQMRQFGGDVELTDRTVKNGPDGSDVSVRVNGMVHTLGPGMTATITLSKMYDSSTTDGSLRMSNDRPARTG